jgi:hypothetical protein
MKIFRNACLIAVSFTLLRNVFGQDFTNLNFEQSTIVSSSPSGYGFNSGTANVPGWTEYNGYGDVNYSGGMTVVYNDQTLDDSGVALEGTNYFTPSIKGKYSIFMYGGSFAAENSTNGSAIGQTGQIPLTTQSLTYLGLNDNNLQITFNGQLLSFNAISSTPNYTMYGADISAYAGQTGELLFTAPWQTGEGMIDNIQFSSSPIPEPNTLSLFSYFLFLCWRLKWPNKSLQATPNRFSSH